MDMDRLIIDGFDILPTPVFIKHADGRMMYCNKTFYESFDFDGEDIRGGKGFEEFADKFDETDMALLQGKGTQTYEVRLPDSSGTCRNWQIRKKLLVDEATGEAKAIVGVVLDITDRVDAAKKTNRINRMKDIAIQMNRQLLHAEEGEDTLGFLLEKSIELIPEARFGAILILDEDGFLELPTTRGYPEEMTRTFKLRPEDSLVFKDTGRIPEKICIVKDIDRMEAVERPEMLVLDGESVKTSLVSPIWLEGEFYGFINIDSTKRNAFNDEDIEVMDYMREHIQKVLSDMRGYNEKLMLMRTDYVTGIFNRRYFEELAKKGVGFSKNSGQRACFVIMDIDNMKLINDTYGHMAGDFMLKSFAQRIVSSVRGCDIMGRYGGDEFAVFFPGSEKKAILIKMEDIRKEMVENLVQFEEFEIPLEFSYGISEYPAEGNSYHELIKIADDNMYADKKERKQRKKD